jgi:acyl dehydratase
MRFAEFHAGQVIEAGPCELSADELLRFARDYDPQWFHTDPEAAASGPHGGLIASGWQTCGIAMRLAAQAALEGSESFASPGLAYVKWPHPVRPGDRLRLRATVIETRTSRRRPTLGLLRWRWQLFNAAGAEVLDLEATSLFDLAAARVDEPAGAPADAPAAHLPEIANTGVAASAAAPAHAGSGRT